MGGVNGLGGRLTHDGQTAAGWMAAALEISMEAVEDEEDDKKRTGEQVSRFHIDIAGPMPTVLVSEREHMRVVVDDYYIQGCCASSRRSKCSKCLW